MIKNYAKQTLKWEQKVQGGYGVTYADAITVEDCYIEHNVRLTRGQDDTNTTSTLVILFENKEFTQGDILVLPNNKKYLITQIETFYKPRSTTFDHLELMCNEIINE